MEQILKESLAVGSTDIGRWIHSATIFKHFKMYVGASRAT